MTPCKHIDMPDAPCIQRLGRRPADIMKALCVIQNSITFAPKYRRQAIYGQIRTDIGSILL